MTVLIKSFYILFLNGFILMKTSRKHGIASGGVSVDGMDDDNNTDYILETYELDGRRGGRIHCSHCSEVC